MCGILVLFRVFPPPILASVHMSTYQPGSHKTRGGGHKGGRTHELSLGLAHSLLVRFVLFSAAVLLFRRGNFLGHGGLMASAFGALTTDLWTSDKASIRPTKFKQQVRTIARRDPGFAWFSPLSQHCLIQLVPRDAGFDLSTQVGESMPLFAGYEQQDVQEFLAFLLDAVHEDLNRVPNAERKYVEAKEAKEGEPEEMVAMQAWKGYLEVGWAGQQDTRGRLAIRGLGRHAQQRCLVHSAYLAWHVVHDVAAIGRTRTLLSPRARRFFFVVLQFLNLVSKTRPPVSLPLSVPAA